MKNAILLEPTDIKKLIAEKYGIPVDKVKSTGYSYFVELGSTEEIKEKEKKHDNYDERN